MVRFTGDSGPIGCLGTVPDLVSSGPGLEDAMEANPSLFLQNDEADILLAAMCGDGSAASRMNEMLLRFFSESKSAHAMRQKAGNGKERVIAQPRLTLFANPEQPEVTGEAIDWGANVVTHLTKRMLYMAQFYVAEGKFDRLKKRAMGLLASHGGSLDRTEFLRKLKIDADTFKKLILTLEMCNLIESAQLERGKIMYSMMAA